MPKSPPFCPRIHAGIFFMLMSALLSSCSSTPDPKRQVAGAFGDLPVIQLANPGSSRTPPHSMPLSEYPFDSSGNYIVGAAR